MGTSGGPDLVVHVLRLAYSLGWVITSEDAANAFNEFMRAALFEALEKIWPEAFELFRLFYGSTAFCIYSYFDDQGNFVVELIPSAEGSRQGCPAGGFAHNLVMDFVFKRICDAFPEAVQLAQADDFPAAFPPPPSVGGLPPSDEDWQALYGRIQDRIKAYDELAGRVGISRNPEKGVLLLPKNAPWPHSRFLHGPFALRPTYDGTIISGGGIGPDEFVKTHGMSVALKGKGKADAFLKLNNLPLGSFMAFQLVTHCASKAMSYQKRITSPRLLRDALIWFDGVIDDSWLACLESSGALSPHLDPRTKERALAQLRLPPAAGGTGVIKDALTSPAAFLSSLVTQWQVPFIRHNLHPGFSEDIAGSVSFLREACNLAGNPDPSPASQFLPANPLDFAPTNPLFPTSKTLQRGMQRAISTRLQRTLVEAFATMATARAADESDPSACSDSTRMLTAVSRSQFG